MNTNIPNTHPDTSLPPYSEAWPGQRHASTEPKTEQHLPTAMEVDNTTERSSTLSSDDYEVARALASLQEGSPSTSTIVTTNQRLDSQNPSDGQPQPLFSLFIEQHPLMATAINNSLSAYSNSKSYSPSFKVGAEFLERNIGAPMANTMGTASRISGVETGMRWWLKRNDSGNSTSASNPKTQGNKRRRESEGASAEAERVPVPGPPLVHRPRGLSELSQPESLPPYDDRRSPAYEEDYVPPQQQQTSLPQTPSHQSWSTRVAISTSGLGVAMSDESLRSLKYCLTWLRWANDHLRTVLSSLQTVLEEWERAQRQQNTPLDGQDSAMEGVVLTDSNSSQQQQQQPRDQATIAQHLQALKNETVKTLKTALDVVSKYAGGALPENARWLVRCHLTSLPARFRIASTQSQSRNGSVDASASSSNGAGDEEAQTLHQPEAVTGAQKVVILAKEGLEMMGQVSAVVNETIVSAEHWCEKLGRRRNGGEGAAAGQQPEGQSETGMEKKEGDSTFVLAMQTSVAPTEMGAKEPASKEIAEAMQMAEKQ